jgi:hypothetical protein
MRQVGNLDFIEGYTGSPMIDPALTRRAARVIDSHWLDLVPFDRAKCTIVKHSVCDLATITSDDGYFHPEVSWIPFEQEYEP